MGDKPAPPSVDEALNRVRAEDDANNLSSLKPPGFNETVLYSEPQPISAELKRMTPKLQREARRLRTVRGRAALERQRKACNEAVQATWLAEDDEFLEDE